ncbi:MAG TPA: hypothetical protein VGR02_19405 [Thermoanaerobaculia bacterium]|jgi:hypothetical protein|nr:hypothetical protein [Thermoanaerobaculia bacterium]
MNRSLKSLLAVAALVALPAFAKNDALSLIPNDAVSVGVVRLADLRTSPLSMTLFEQTDKVGANGESDRFLDDAGLDPKKDIDVLVVAMAPRTNLGSDAEVLIAADGRFNVDRLTTALLGRGATQKNGYLLMPQETGDSGKRGAIAFPSNSLVLLGSESAVTEALASRANGGTTFLTSSGLGREVARIEPRASAWAIVDVARAQRLTGAAKIPQSHAALNAAIKNVSTVALWATDTGDALKLGGFGLAHDEETLQLVEDTLRGALAAMRLAVQDKVPEMVPVLRKFSVSRSNDAVSISGTIPASDVKKLTDAKTRLHAEK